MECIKLLRIYYNWSDWLFLFISRNESEIIVFNEC